jgi:hypothetical protein
MERPIYFIVSCKQHTAHTSVHTNVVDGAGNIFLTPALTKSKNGNNGNNRNAAALVVTQEQLFPGCKGKASLLSGATPFTQIAF